MGYRLAGLLIHNGVLAVHLPAGVVPATIVGGGRWQFRWRFTRIIARERAHGDLVPPAFGFAPFGQSARHLWCHNGCVVAELQQAEEIALQPLFRLIRELVLDVQVGEPGILEIPPRIA